MTRLWLLLAFCLAACTNLSGEPEIVATLPPQTAESSWMPDTANGARIFAERCTDCHGETGDGRGDLVQSGSVPAPLDLTDRDKVSRKSPLGFYDIITEGNLDKLMPPWRDALSEAERWDVALYSYTLGYDEALLTEGERLWRQHCADCDAPAQLPPVYSDAEYGAQLDMGESLAGGERAAIAAYLRMRSLQTPTVTIRGVLQNGTAGGSLPAAASVQLQYGNAERGYLSADSAVEAQGRFGFQDIPRRQDFVYMLGAAYEGRLFSLRLPPDGLADEHTLEIYEAAHDPRVITVARIDMAVDAVRLNDLGAGLAVEQLIGYRNESDRIYTSGRGFEDGREASLLLQLPQGARLMSGTDGGRFVVIEDMADLPDSLIDTLPVPPGDAHEIRLRYFLPFAGALDFAQAYNNLLDAEVGVSLPRALQLDGALRLADEDGDFRHYVGALRMEAQPALRFSLQGDPFATSSDDSAVITSESLTPMLLGAALALSAALGAGLYWRRRSTDGDEIEQVAQALAQLEVEHDQGRINHDLYHHRRRELQARLDALRDEDA